jgi:hypothetical protein
MPKHTRVLMKGRTSFTILFCYWMCLSGCTAIQKDEAPNSAWLKDSLNRELGLMMPMDALKVVNAFQEDAAHPTIIAIVKIDQLNGGLFIYRWNEKAYRLTYRKKEPVYTFEATTTGEYFLFESGFTGTGVKNTFFHLLKINSPLITEMWTDTASHYNFTSAAPYHSMDGSVQLLAHDGVLMYTKIERTYLRTEIDLNKPDTMNSTSSMIKLVTD